MTFGQNIQDYNKYGMFQISWRFAFYQVLVLHTGHRQQHEFQRWKLVKQTHEPHAILL